MNNLSCASCGESIHGDGIIYEGTPFHIECGESEIEERIDYTMLQETDLVCPN